MPQYQDAIANLCYTVEEISDRTRLAMGTVAYEGYSQLLKCIGETELGIWGLRRSALLE